MDGSVHTSPLLKISSKALKKISENELKITLFSTVSLLALTGCGGGGGGGIFATSGAGGSGGALLGGMLLKGPISGARVYQDLNFNNQYDPGEPTAFTNPDGSYSLSAANRTAPIITVGGIDTTTGADAGVFKFDSGEDISTVTPVSVVVSQLDPLIDQNTAFAKFSGLSTPVNFSNYNPIQTAADAGGANSDAAIVDAVGAQMQSTINGLSTLLAEISSIASQNSYQDAVDAIVAEINSGSSVDFENPAHLVSIFNRTGLSGSEFSPVVTSVTNAIAEVNKQLYTMFTQDSGDFLDADARGIALLAQTDLVDAISNLASSPVDDAASALEAQFSAANVTSLAAELANQVPEYDPVTGAASIIASMDRVKGEIGSTVTSTNLVSNDVVVSGTAPLVAVGLSTSKTGEDVDLNAPFTKDIGKITDHGFSTGQKVTGGGTDYYLVKLDDDHFVLATSSSNAEAVSIQTATYDETNNTYSLEGNAFANGDEITLFDSENGIGDSYQIDVVGDQFSLQGNPSIVNDGANISFVKTSGLYQSDNVTPSLTYKKFLLSKTDSNNIVATLNPDDGTVSIDIPNGTNPGTYTFFYQVTDQEGKVAVGPINIDVPVKKPTLTITDNITDIPEQKDGDYLEIDIGQYIDFDLSGSSDATLSFRGFNQSDLYQVSGVSLDNNIGLFFKSEDTSPPNLTMLDDSKDRQIAITNENDDKTSVKDNLVLRLDKDFIGTIDLNAFITVTNNNKFSSATDVLKFNVSPVADTPIITLTDRSTIDGVDVEGVEDLPIRIFKTENGDSILSLTSGDVKNTETLSLIVKKEVLLKHIESDDSDDEPAIVNYVDAESLLSIGTATSYDFGNLDENGNAIGVEDALEFSQTEFNNLSVVLPSNYEGIATLQVVAKSIHGSSKAFSSVQDIDVKALPAVDDISIIVENPGAGVEDTSFYVNLTTNQVDVGEDLRVFIGNFERQDASGNWVAVDPSDIGGISGFRPSIFATYSNNFFMFSSLPGDDGNTIPLQSGQNLSFEFLPLTDFNGDLRYQVFSRTIESDGVSKDTSVITKIQNFDPRSEDPNVELGGNLTTNEYQGQSDYVSQKLGIGDLQVDQADSLEKMRATIKFFTNSDPFDASTATLLSSAGNFTTLDISSVPSNLLSNLSIDNSTPGQFIIDVTPTKTDGVVTTSSVDNLKTIMSNIGVLPPEDYSTNSGNDIRVEIQIQAKEPGAEFSAPSGGDFTLIVNPVASKPTVSDSSSGIRTGLEDTLTKISEGITFTVDDLDGSETIVAVNISGVSTGYALVDSSNNAIGVSDGAGTVTLTNISLVSGTTNQYELSSDVYLRAPNDESGNISLSVSAIAKENNSGATFVSDTSSINVTISPVADKPSVSVPSSSSSSPIKIGEYVDGSTYANTSDYIKLTTSISELNSAEVMEGIFRFKQSEDGNSATFLLNNGSSPTAVSSDHADYKASYDTYVLSENDVKNLLAGASFRPPEGVINKDNDPTYDATYIVEVIGRSTDGSDVGETEHNITYQIAAVAKAPIIKNESGQTLDTSFVIGDVIKTGDNSHKMKISLDVQASGDEQITLLMTNLPSSLSEYLSFENAQGTAIGAKNADGSVYVLTMDQLEVDGSAGISSSTEFFYLVLSSGAQITDLNTSYSFTGNLSEVGNSSGFQVDSGIIKNSAGTPLQQKSISVDLTGFALDTVGGTTASKGLTGSGDIYYLQGDPLVIDFNGGSLDDSNFTSLANALDVNMDGTLDTVYMPNSNTGLLIYDKDGNQFSSYVNQDSSRLNLKDHIFSEFFKFGNVQGTSSLDSISLLDEDNNNIINNQDTNNFGKIFVWRDSDVDGVLDSGEFTALASDASIDLNNTTSVNQGAAGNSAYILQSAQIDLGTSGDGIKDLYEVSLENTITTPANAPSWEGKDVSFVTAREGGTTLKHVQFNEGLTDGTESLHLNLSSGSDLTSSHVTLITIRGLPNTLSLNKGSKLENGDWLLLEEDIPVESGDSDLKIIAQDLNFSGSFSLSAWSVTSEPLSGESTVSKPVYLVGNILPVADDPNLFVQTDGVIGEEDDTGIPVTIRYELSDNSETVDIKLEIEKTHVTSPTGGADLKFTYDGGEITLGNMTDNGNTYSYIFDDISSANDSKITSLKIVPAKDYFSTAENPLLLKVSAIVTDGEVEGSPVEKTINVVIEERADPVEISFNSFSDSQVDTIIQEDDTELEVMSAERNSSTSDTLEIDSYEKIASDIGIVILKTDQNGNYDILNKSSDGSNLLNTEIQSIKFEISGITEGSNDSALISQFILQVDENSFVPKVEADDGLETFTFSVPSLESGKSIKLITPENFDNNVSFKIYSVVSANGDTALSQPINLNIDIFSDGSPADVSVSPSTAIEDGPAFRLPLTVTLKDNSENITSLKLDSSQLNEILYLTRLQNLTIEEDGASIDGITFENDFISSPELIIRFSNNFKSSLETVSLEQQIKTEFENGNDISTKVSNIESLLQSFGLSENTDWNFFAKGQSLDSDGVEETNFEQLNFQDGDFSLSSSSNNLEKNEFVENTIDSSVLSKVGNIFTIDIEQLATDISPVDASSETLKQAQIWISGKLGGKVTSDTTSGFDVNVTVITEDADNKDSSSTDPNFGAGLFDTRELLGKTEQVLKVTFVETNDLPVVTNVNNDMTYHEGGDHVLLLTQAGFSDEDNTNFNGGTISAKLISPEVGDNIFVFNSASISLSGTGELSDSQPTVGVLDSSNVVIGQLQKSFSEDGNDVIGFNLTLNEEADASDIEAILHAIGYSNSGSILETRDVPYEISIEDGSGPDIDGNPSTKILGNIITANPQPIGTYVEGDELAQNEVATTTINLFETIDISDNGFAPDSIQLKINNFISGDIIGTTSTLVTSSYDADTGILSITSNVSSENNNEKTASFHDAINKTFYSSENDNPTQLYINNDHSIISNDRTIQVVSIDNSTTTTVDEGRVIGTFKVEFTPKDDLPELIVNDFNRVQLSADTNDEGLSQLKVQSTQLLPNTLFDQVETDALDITKFGKTGSGLIFDPDSMINEITIEITSIDPLSLNAAKSQDKLMFKSSSDAGFKVEGEDGTSVLKINLSDEIIESQTNADNQAMVETALRNIYYENNEPLSQVITGFRDLKITFKDKDDVTSVMYDSANISEHQKVIQVGSGDVGNGNVLPSISGIESPASFHEGTEHIFLVSEGQINDQNGSIFPGGVVKVSLNSPFEGEQIKLISNETITIKDNKFVNTSDNTIEYGHFYNKISNESVYNFTSEQLQAITNDGILLNEGLYSIVQDTQNTYFYLQEIETNNETFNPVKDSHLIKLSKNYQSKSTIDSFISSEGLISEGDYHRVEMLINFSTTSSEESLNVVGINEVQSILRTIGYTVNNSLDEFNIGTTNYDISIHDGFGMNVSGELFNHFSGQVIRTSQENAIEFVEGSEFAIENVPSSEVGLFNNVSLIGSGFPETIEVKITDVRSGDILRANSSNVEQNYNSETGILSLTNPEGTDNSSKLQSFEEALNNIFYTSINDNPTFELTDIERSTDPERLIEIKILDSDITNDINESRTVSKIKVNLTSQNDDPVILVNDFNRVQLLPVTEEDGSTQLKAQSTFLLPVSLGDQPETDALGASLYGESSSGLIFDPDSMISQITIEITSPDLSTLDVARNQDKLIFDPSYENGFVLEGEEGTSILSLTLSSDIIESQTNADNQAMVEEALRSIKYENDKPLSEIISGFRDIKITFKDSNDVVTVPYDSGAQPELAKVLIGKAFEPGDTHNSLNIPISENQISSDQMMANIQFKIITESGVEDSKDELFIIDENDNIIDTVNYLGASADGFAQYEWKPNVSLTNNDIIGILKNKIAFGGEFFTQSGLRTIEVQIFDQDGVSIGPAGLKTAIFVQPHDRNSILGTENGDIVDKLDIADDSNERDVVDYSKFHQNFPLTINLDTSTTSYVLSDGSTKQVQVQGFDNVVGSDADDIFIASSTGGANHFAGGIGDDEYSGSAKDFINYSLEDAYSKSESIKSGINADLTTGIIIDTYGDNDSIDPSNPITNIIGSQNNDIIIDSDADNIILGGYGEDRIISSRGNDILKGGLGDDLIEVGEGDDVIYGDNEISSGGKDTFIFKGQFGNDTIEDFEVNNDKVILEINENDSITLEGIDTNSVKIKKINTQDNFLTLNSTAGIITASTLALATTEVMGLTTLSNVSANLELDGDEDIIDFTRLIDTGLIIDLDNKTINENFYFVGYENIIGGIGNDQITHLNSNDLQIGYGIVGGEGQDNITASNIDIIRYDLEEKYRSDFTNIYGVNVNLLENESSSDTYGNEDHLIADNVYGTSLDDNIIGNENNNIIYGNGGNDNLSGRGGDDIIVGGSGADFIDGGTGNDILTGDDGYVQNADFFLFKGLADDISSFGDDTVTDFEVGLDYARIYLSNNDELVNDTSYTFGTKISTGSSTIEFEWSRYEQFDKYEELMASIQEVRLLEGSLENLSGTKAAQGIDDVVQLSKLGSENQDGYIIDVGFQQMISLSDSSEAYEFFDMENYDNFIGSAGDDIIIGAGSEGSGLAGGQGDDVIYGSSLDYLAYDLEEELITEEVIGTELNKINNHVKVNLGDGNVNLDGIMIDARTAEDIWGSTDTIIGVENVRTTSGEDIVYGSQNSNTIMTGDGSDKVYSGGGDDVIYGGVGNDILDGGDGEDTFVFLASDYENGVTAQDTILNFNKDEDILSFDDLGMGEVSISYFEDDQSLADTVISFNNNPDWGSIVLVDVGKLNEDEINIDTDAVVGGIG